MGHVPKYLLGLLQLTLDKRPKLKSLKERTLALSVQGRVWTTKDNRSNVLSCRFTREHGEHGLPSD